VQVDPIKPTWKAPGSKRLELQYGEQLSNFAFKFNLRRYNGADAVALIALMLASYAAMDPDAKAVAGTVDMFSAAGVEPLFQLAAFQSAATGTAARPLIDPFFQFNPVCPVGSGQYCTPRLPSRAEPSFLESNGIL